MNSINVLRIILGFSGMAWICSFAFAVCSDSLINTFLSGLAQQKIALDSFTIYWVRMAGFTCTFIGILFIFPHELFNLIFTIIFYSISLYADEIGSVDTVFNFFVQIIKFFSKVLMILRSQALHII